MEKIMKTIILSMTMLGACSALIAADDAAIKVYDKHCLKCHGASGAGDGNAAVKLKLKMNNWTVGAQQAQFTDTQAADAIKNGKDAKSIKISKKMPATGAKLSEAEIEGQ